MSTVFDAESASTLTPAERALVEAVRELQPETDKPDQETKPTTCTEDAARKFKRGDVVQLNSGGVRMTVVDQQCLGYVGCFIGIYDPDAADLVSISIDECCLKMAADRDDDIPF